MIQFRVSQCAKCKHIKKLSIVKSVTKRVSNLSLEDLELQVKSRGIKGYKSMSIDKLFSILDAPQRIKENKPIRDIRKENPNTDKISKKTRNLFKLEKEKNISF